MARRPPLPEEPSQRMPAERTVCSAMAAMAVGYFRAPIHAWERVCLLAGGVCLMDGGIITDIIGLVLVIGIFALNIHRSRTTPKTV